LFGSELNWIPKNHSVLNSRIFPIKGRNVTDDLCYYFSSFYPLNMLSESNRNPLKLSTRIKLSFDIDSIPEEAKILHEKLKQKWQTDSL